MNFPATSIARGARRNFQRCGGPDSIDASVGDEQRRIRDRRGTRPIDHSRANERDHACSCWPGRQQHSDTQVEFQHHEI